MTGVGHDFPPPTRVELPGWELVWCRLAVVLGVAVDLERAWHEEQERFRRRHGERQLTAEPTVQAVRRLFKAAGCDPTRYRPSSEALARRVLRGESLPRIHPLVDVNNLLSLELLVPACVVDPAHLAPPLVLRRGGADERMLSLRGDFALADKPLLADGEGPFGTPITDSERVKVGTECGEAWLVAYLPAASGGASLVEVTLRAILQRFPAAALLAVADGAS